MDDKEFFDLFTPYNESIFWENIHQIDREVARLSKLILSRFPGFKANFEDTKLAQITIPKDAVSFDRNKQFIQINASNPAYSNFKSNSDDTEIEDWTDQLPELFEKKFNQTIEFIRYSAGYYQIGRQPGTRHLPFYTQQKLLESSSVIDKACKEVYQKQSLKKIEKCPEIYVYTFLKKHRIPFLSPYQIQIKDRNFSTYHQHIFDFYIHRNELKTLINVASKKRLPNTAYTAYKEALKKKDSEEDRFCQENNYKLIRLLGQNKQNIAQTLSKQLKI